eukprot:366444-Chlamydomonas_euryale.AAC.7
MTCKAACCHAACSVMPQVAEQLVSRLPTNISVVIAHGLWKYFSVPSDPTLLSSYTAAGNEDAARRRQMPQ